MEFFSVESQTFLSRKKKLSARRETSVYTGYSVQDPPETFPRIVVPRKFHVKVYRAAGPLGEPFKS